jgi:Ca-activated chloride channel family protein
LTVSILDRNGRPYPGLKPENFSAWVDKVPRQIISLAIDTRPASIGLLVDASGSIGPLGKKASKEYWRNIGDQVLRFLEINNPENEYFAAIFDEKVAISERWIGSDPSVLQKVIAPGNRTGTAFLDALYYSVQNVMNGRHSRRVIVMISDGEENCSKRTFKDVRELLKRSDVIFYAIAIGNDEGIPLGAEGTIVLDEFAGLTGGRAYVLPPKSKAEVLKEVFDVIAEELKNQYRLSIEKPVVAGSEKFRKFKVKTGPREKDEKWPKLYIRTREGYYQ